MEPAPYPSETSVEAHLKKYSSQMRALETDLSMVQVEIDGMEKLQTRDVKMFVSSKLGHSVYWEMLLMY